MLRALLGPTNTGKTHRAIERMLEHDTGMIGLPLRLLAREVYDRVSTRVGESAVALVTGEEKRIPVRPRYWVCTVEAMPVGLAVDFLAVDEVQLATHRQRGHVFTDRMQHARGARETWFLGSATIRPLLMRLCPTAEVESRPRLSTLSNAGSMSLSTLPPRSVVVAFSATRVYELAERLRTKRGGAAVVIGALSPRARNAQVALFQSGEVDTLVATDAIGMGLNLDVDNVVFADLRKFDGRQARPLEDAELAQIAGRAGRHQRDGRFATLEPLLPLPVATVRALERHRFPADERVFWRNHQLDLDSIEGLLASLRKRPGAPHLTLADDAEDLRAVMALSRIAEVRAAARGPEAVGLLWEICQVPDFRQLPFDDHFKLLAACYLQLVSGRARLERPWIDAHLAHLERFEGDLETLLDRMSAVRTWTYITAHRSAGQPWVEDASGWQARTHALEDRLSDALHEKLVQRFVEAPGKRGRRTAPAMPAARGTHATGQRSLAAELAAKVAAVHAPVAASSEERAAARLEELIEAPHERFVVAPDGRIAADDVLVGRLVRGADLLHPDVSVAGNLGAAGARLQLSRRLLAFARDLVAEILAPLALLHDARLGPGGHGLVYQLEQSLGSVPAGVLASQMAELSAGERRILGGAGLVLGRLVVFVPALLSAESLRKRWALCAAELWPERTLRAPAERPDGSPALVLPEADDLSPRLCAALGHPWFGGLAVRADVLEAVGREVARGASVTGVAAHLGISVTCATTLVAEARDALSHTPAAARPGARQRRPRASRS